MPSEANPSTIRAALYARGSSDLQSAVSIEDQLRIGAEHATKEGWQVVERYLGYGQFWGMRVRQRPGPR